MKFLSFISLLTLMLCFAIPAYPSWTEYNGIRYLDLDGDLTDEIIIEAKHGAGSNHYIEDMRIFKDKYPELELIFTIRTLDSYFGLEANNNYNIVSDVKFTEQTPENNGIRDIVVTSKKIYFKDKDNKIVDKEEDLGTKTYKWDTAKFIENQNQPFFAETYTVKRVINGNTLELSDGEKVRLIGIDVPEVDTKETAQTKDFIKSLVEGKEVKLEFDVQERDKSGRLLAYVYVPVHSYSYIARDKDGNSPDFNPWDVADSFSDKPKGMGVLPELLNAYIIRNGYATPMTIPPNVKYADLFQKLYQEARENKRGLWR